jgi:probable HAF family extracellular repeat protein
MKRPAITAVLLLALATAARAEADPRHTVRDLGTLAGSSSAADINDAGWVVGSVNDGPNYRAFLWLPGPALGLGPGMHDLGTLADGASAHARAIDAAGRVVGSSRLTDRPFGFDWRGFVWDQGTLTDLGTLEPWPMSFAEGINDAGEIVGSVSSFGCLPILWLPEPRYGLPAGINDLPTVHPFNWPEGGARDINDHGQVVGYAIRSCDAPNSYHPYLWLPKPAFGLPAGPHDLLPLAPSEGFWSEAEAINDLGEVVGHRSDDFEVFEPLIWREGVAEPLPLPPGVESGFATNLNDLGQVVGYSGSYDPGSSPRALLWDQGQVFDLNDLIPRGSGWELNIASAINLEGQIVGRGVHNGETRAFLLTPAGPGLVEIPTLDSAPVPC